VRSRQHDKAAQERHLGKPLLYGRTLTGAINIHVRVWVYESAGNQAARRATSGPDRPDYCGMVRVIPTRMRLGSSPITSRFAS
jgi:hypothetical protein